MSRMRSPIGGLLILKSFGERHCYSCVWKIGVQVYFWLIVL